MPLRRSTVIDRQSGSSRQQRVRDELLGVYLPIGDRDAQVRCDGSQETALDGGTGGHIRTPRYPKHPRISVDRLGDGDLEIEAKLVDDDGIGNDVKAMGPGQLCDGRLVGGHVGNLSVCAA